MNKTLSYSLACPPPPRRQHIPTSNQYQQRLQPLWHDCFLIRPSVGKILLLVLLHHLSPAFSPSQCLCVLKKYLDAFQLFTTAGMKCLQGNNVLEVGHISNVKRILSRYCKRYTTICVKKIVLSQCARYFSCTR